MLVLKVLVGLISTASLAALAIYAWLLYKGTSETLYSTINTRLMDWRKRAFVGLAAVAFLASIYNGIDSMLFWMPDTWGSIDEDGDFRTVRTALAGVGAFLIGLPLIQVIDSATHMNFRHRMQELTSAGLEEILKASHDPRWLERLKEGHLKRIEELERDCIPRTTDSHLTMKGQEVLVLRELVWRIEEQIRLLEPA